MQHTNQSLLDTLVPEIRRGGIVLAVLARIAAETFRQTPVSAVMPGQTQLTLMPLPASS